MKVEPTYRAGGALNLAWMNTDKTCAWVEREMCIVTDLIPIFESKIFSTTTQLAPINHQRAPIDKQSHFAKLVLR